MATSGTTFGKSILLNSFKICKQNVSAISNRVEIVEFTNYHRNIIPTRNFCYATYTAPLPKIIQSDIRKTSKDMTSKAHRVSKAMKAYLERAEKLDEFMQREREEFEIGRRHLANIMGKDPENFDQDDINEAIEYLLPSGLFDKHARPIMKHPDDIFPRRKDAEFDISGRPYHTFFYTMNPNFFQVLHEAASKIEQLNKFEDSMIKSGTLEAPESKKLILAGSEWLSQSELEDILLERLKEFKHKEFVGCFDRLGHHPYAYMEKDFIFKFRKELMSRSVSTEYPEPIIREDGRRYIETIGLRKTIQVKVKMVDMGSGLININGKDISFFENIKERQQLLFPLQFTGYLHKVDFEAEVICGRGESAIAGAIRHSLSQALASFVSSEERERMRIAGLLTRDRRRRERKKPGQEGARRKYTWKKR